MHVVVNLSSLLTVFGKSLLDSEPGGWLPTPRLFVVCTVVEIRFKQGRTTFVHNPFNP